MLTPTAVQCWLLDFVLHAWLNNEMNEHGFVMQERLEQELKSVQKYRKYWNHIKKKDVQADEQTKTKWVNYVTGT